MASVKYLLNRPKSEKPTSILVRFHSKSTGSVTVSTGEMIPPSAWDWQRVKARHKGYDRINKHLSKIEGDLLDTWRENKHLPGLELSELIKKVVKGESTPQKKTILEAFRKFIAQYQKEKEKATITKYKALYRKLESFNPDLTFEQLDFNFYDQFKNWLYGNTNKVYGKGYSLFPVVDGTFEIKKNNGGHPIPLFDDVVFKYFINLKTICTWAEKRGYTPHPSYKSWEIIKREYPPIALTQDELHRIEALNLPQAHLDLARDYLCLECRTGQRISDLRRFRREDINGHVWTFAQKKGARLNQKTVSLPLVGYCAPALVILQKYNYELPIISEQHLNRHIKTVCKRAGIDQHIYIERWAGNKKVRIPGPKFEFISTHTGRKTFITIALQFMSPQMVMNITGIRSFNTLKHYAGESEIGLVEEGLRKIEDGKAIMKKAN